MRHILPITLIICSFFVFVCFNTANASNFSISNKNPFGGRVINKKAFEIETLEKTNWTCVVPGETIQLTPYNKAPSSYIIPNGTSSKTGYSIKSLQMMLGLYSVITTPITCTFNGTPPATTIVNLPTIKLYGNSKY
jgi:hypothetical protein